MNIRKVYGRRHQESKQQTLKLLADDPLHHNSMDLFFNALRPKKSGKSRLAALGMLKVLI